MEGTFKFGDLLIFEPAPLPLIQPGDVVIYRGLNHRGEHVELVHRVVAVTSDGLVMRGDNNPAPDRLPVKENNLLGKVSYIERDGICLPVSRRPKIPFRSRVSQGFRHVRSLMSALAGHIGRSSYRKLRRSGLIGILWKPPIKKIFLQTNDGPLIKYVYRNRTVVAHYFPAQERLHCRKPFDLVLSKKNRRAWI
jgi:signal peptidase I